MTGLDHADLMLLMLGAPTDDPEQDGRCAGITRLEKLVYLVEEDSDFRRVAREPAAELHFKPYHYGPYTREIYDALDLLIGIGLVNEHRVATGTSLDVAEELDELDPLDLGVLGPDTETPYVERTLELSNKGRYVANVLAERVGGDAVAEISGVKDRYGRMPLRQLLRHVYREHSDMTTRSRIKDKL
jgi:uncharacterized protein